MAELNIEHLQEVKQGADLIYSKQQIMAALDQMAVQLEKRLQDTNAIVLCVMNGGLVFTSDLIRHMDCEVRLDYVHVTRYQNNTTGSELEWLREPESVLQNQIVLIVDDIFDEGHTLAELVAYCKRKGAREVISCVLLNKQKQRRAITLEPDFYGLLVPDRYVFGYGMDYQGYLRNLPDIYAVDASHE